VLLLSGWAFLPTSGGRQRQRLLRGIEGGRVEAAAGSP
jgi:hypothetical protein